MSLFSRKSKDEMLLILDIQSSVIRGSLVLLPADASHKPEIVFAHEKNIPYRKNATSGFLVKAALRGVSEVLSAAERHVSLRAVTEGLPHRIRSVHYALSSPWIISQARTVSARFPKDTEITRGRVMEMIEKQRTGLALDPNDRIATIEEKVFDVRLNGYSVLAWEGRLAREVEVSFVMSAAGTSTIDMFREAVAGAVPEKRVYFHSSLLLQTIGIRRIMPARDAYTLVHIHGELTDVVVVDKSSCVFFGSYPTGIRTVVRKLAKAAGTDLQAADSLLTLYLSDHLEAGKREALSKVIHDISQGWNSEYDRLFKTDSAPMVSASHPAIVFCRFHERFFVDSFIAAHPGARVEVLSFEDIAPHIVYRPAVDRMRVTGLYAVAMRNLDLI